MKSGRAVRKDKFSLDLNSKIMDQHRKVLGIIYVVTACLQIMGLLILSMVFSTILALVKDNVAPSELWITELVFNLLRILPWIIVIFISIPSVIAGIGLLNKQRWALVMALILGCIKLFSFPIGTAIGVYSIWVYVESGKTENIPSK
jgi:hypothetical protein